MNYIEYINSPEWRVRSRLYRNKHPKCELCGCNDRFKLQTHHISYRNIGHESDEDLMTVCRYCHEFIEEVKSYNEDNSLVLPLYAKFLNQIDFAYHNDSRDLYDAMGDLSRIYDLIIDKALELYKYSDKIPETDSFKNILNITLAWRSEFGIETNWMNKIEGELQTPEITLPHVEYYLWSKDDSYAFVTANRVFLGINGIDERVTYLKDSGDDLFDAISWLITEANLNEIDLILHTLRAYCVEVNNLYSLKYPLLTHNARIVGSVLSGQTAECYNSIQ